MKNSARTWMLVAIAIGIALSLMLSGCGKDRGIVKVTSNEMQPDAYFKESVDAFVNEDYKASADAIGKAAAAMELVAAEAGEQQQASIRNSIAELLDLQSNVAVDRVAGLEELNYFFARAGQALAGTHIHVSETEYFSLDGSKRKAGEELNRAIALIEHCMTCSYKEYGAGEQALVAEMRTLADMLERGENVAEDDIRLSFKKLNEHLEEWSNEIEVDYHDLNTTREVIIDK